MKVIHSFVRSVMVSIFIFLPHLVGAADVWTEAWREVSSVGIEAGYGSQYTEGTFQTFVARIIAQLLTFLGILFFVLILYAGFLWLTSAGSEEQIGRAKKILISASIGLGIVVLAYAITTFVLRAFLTGAGMDSLNP